MKKKLFQGLLAIALLIICTSISAQSIIRVNHASTATNPDGSSWALAYNDLQNALAVAQAGDEIWIAKGTYYPDASDRNVAFTLTKDIKLYGHFEGGATNEQSLSERNMSDVMDMSAIRTILSGDIQGTPTVDSDNSRNVIFVNPPNKIQGIDIVVDGLTIAKGFQDLLVNGAGFRANNGIKNSSYSFSDVIFYQNKNIRSGAGIFCNSVNSSLQIERTKFLENEGDYGSAFLQKGGNNLTVTNSIFAKNKSNRLGVIYVSGGYARIENCSFSENKSFSSVSTDPIDIYYHGSNMEVSNSIFWHYNTDPAHLEISEQTAGTVTVNNSIVEGGYTGPNQNSVINLDPKWGTDLNLLVTSPAIDAGANNLYNSPSLIDIDRDVRIKDGTIDMGAQEFSQPLPQNVLLVDLNSSCTTGCGGSWLTAFSNLQDALAAAQAGDEIWVAKGTYNPSNSGNQNTSFAINKSISIYGHFIGGVNGETSLSQRDLSDLMDINANRTILSGDIGVINSTHVLTTTSSNIDMSLNQLSVENGDGTSKGAGINITGSNKSVTVDGVIFEDNVSTNWGGAICNQSAADLTILSSKFLSNKGENGSAVFHYGTGSFLMSNSIIQNNISGIANAIYYNAQNSGKVAIIENCSFSGNIRLNNDLNNSRATCIFSFASEMEINNCILWGNGSPNHQVEITESSTAKITVNNSVVENPVVENANGSTDQFAVSNSDPQWDVSSLELSLNSPAINAGQNSLFTYNGNTDINGNQRIFAGTIDMGAQERNIDPDAFVITVEATDIGNGDFEITIPTYGAGYDYDVDWGNGSNTSNETGDATKSNYSTAGPFTIQITGDFPRIYYLKQTPAQRKKIKAIDQWGAIQWSSMYHAFNGCTQVEYLASDAPDLSNVTSLQSMFYSCSSLNGDLNNWDVSNVKTMTYLFANAISFNGDISSWNVSNVTNMGGMFQSATSFNQDLKDWNVGEVRNMGYMFYNVPTFNSDLSAWDVKNVTNMDRMLYLVNAFTNGNNNYDPHGTNDTATGYIGINKWDVSKVKNFSGLFGNCTNFDRDVSSWKTISATQMVYTFLNCSSFNQDISGWNVSNVTNLNGMLQSATSFNQNLGSWKIGGLNYVNSIDYTLYNAGLDECNYDATLQGWFSTYNGIPNTLRANGIKYSHPSHRANLINAGLSSIFDSGQNSTSCATNPSLRKKSPSSIADASSIESQLVFYPNPTSNSFQIDGFEEQVQLILLDISGKVVLQTQVINNNQIDVSSLAKGIYILQANDQFGHSIYEKLIIE